ncbi:MAG: chemotaxis protein CheW [Ruminococcus sp.]|jgi:purine-binding chemotaxis protein CheW|nr:chemotaxis protein CheW [Ruminococcus sp.]
MAEPWKRYDDEAEMEEELRSNEQKYLTFYIEGLLYAFNINRVETIIKIQEITPIPEFPKYSKGIIDLRGLTVPVIDVRLRFHKSEAEYTSQTCIIVVSIANIQIGFIVDTVGSVVDIEQKNITPIPRISGDKQAAKFIDGVGRTEDKKIIMILDASKMLDKEEIKSYEELYYAENADVLGDD